MAGSWHRRMALSAALVGAGCSQRRMLVGRPLRPLCDPGPLAILQNSRRDAECQWFSFFQVVETGFECHCGDVVDRPGEALLIRQRDVLDPLNRRSGKVMKYPSGTS